MNKPKPGQYDSEYVRRLVEVALKEDAPAGDITSEACIDASKRVTGGIIAKASGVVFGLEFAQEAFSQCGVACVALVSDGASVSKGDEIIRIEMASATAVLKAERTALNFLGRLSGIATAVREFVAAVDGTGAVILDTRKTTPGLRLAEKAAVRAGGGQNHRIGLSDGILIKENHISACGGIKQALQRCLKHKREGLLIEIEVRDLNELRQAIDSGATRVLLDNMSLETLCAAVEIARKNRVETEASGNVNLSNVREVASTGVDFISIGWITHSAPALDLSLLVDMK